jgi:septum formation protein
VGISYRVVVSDADESSIAGETPADYVIRVARLKAEAVAGMDETGLPVLAADTAVVIDNEILGKPGNQEEARDMLRRLGGRVHEVFSAVVLIDANRQVTSRLNVTRVRFADLNEDWIAAYCATGEPMDKAGAYGVQGCAAHRITEIAGSYSGVMGLPLFETLELLNSAGLNLPPLNRAHGELCP